MDQPLPSAVRHPVPAPALISDRWPLLARLVARAAVAEQEIETLVARCPSSVDATPVEFLRAVVAALEAEGAALLELDATQGVFRALHGLPNPPTPWPVRALPGLAARLARGEPAWIAADMPDTAIDAAWLAGGGRRNVLVLPVGDAAAAPRVLAVHGLATEPALATRGALKLVAALCAAAAERVELSAARARAEERFELTERGSTAALFEWDVAENRIYWSAEFRALFGYGPETAPERLLWRDIVHPDDVLRVERAVAAHLDGLTERFDLVYRCLRRDGTTLWVWGRFSAKRGADGTLRRIVGTVLDISAKVCAEEALQQAQARAAGTLDAVSDAVLTLDASGRIDYANPAAARLLGDAVREGATLAGVLPATEVATVLEGARVHCMSAAAPHRLPDALRLPAAMPGGEPAYVEAAFAPLLDRGAAAAGCVLALHDVTEQRGLAVQLAHQAAHDALTGLVNRREFEARLAGAIDGGTPQALMYFDLDRFKIVNDTCGHAAGDALLQELGGRLRAVAPPDATVARLGGDEFGVLLPDPGAERAPAVAERLRHEVETLRFVWHGRSFRIGASIGLVPVTGGASVTEALAAADTACYAAKDAGRNRVHAGRPGDRELERRREELRRVAGLQAAIAAGRFELWRQAVRALDGDAVHHELLLRMRDEDGRLVAPGDFIPLAERHGLMPELDRWVIAHACAGLAAVPGIHAVNLSGQTLSDPGFLGFVREAFGRHGVDPRRLCLEITETAAIAQPDCALELIHALRAAGCRFALDDFGAGMASFTMLRRLPVDWLKIDGAFVRRILEDPVDRAWVRAANDLGHLMGMRTVAEYAESEAIVVALRELGVDYAQGHGIAKPEPWPGNGTGACGG